MTMHRWRVAFVAATTGLSHSALGGIPTVIFSNIASSPTSDVPGIPGLKFSVTTQTVFQAPHGSPNGERWILAALASGGIVVAGQGTDGNNAFAAARRHDPTFFDPGVTFLTFRPDMGISDIGSFAFSADTNAPTNSDEIVARWTPAGGFELMAREGVQAPDQPPGASYGSGDSRVNIDAEGRVFFLSIGLGGTSGEAIFHNSAIDDGMTLIQTNVTMPENQIGTPQTLKLPFDFRADATGDNYVYSGVLWGGGGSFVALNNVVVGQEDQPLPGRPGTFHMQYGEDGVRISPYGAHYAFRSRATPGWVVVVDGEVVAATGEPIVPGSSELWDAPRGGFFYNVVNSHGDYVIGGFTNAPITDEEVLVWNGRVVLFRSGDGVDLNGDGLPNDGAIIADIRTDSGYLTDHGRFYFSSRITGGEAFLWLPVPVPGDINCDGAINFFDIDPFVLALFDEAGYATAHPDCWRITADINRDGNVNFFDIDPFIACLFDACP